MKKQSNEERIREITVLVPERGSHPQYLISAFQFADVLKTSVKLILSEQWKNERPQKIAFYHEVLEDHLHDSDTSWNTHYVKDDWKEVLHALRPMEDVLVVFRDEEPDFLKEVLLESPCPVLVIPKSFQQECKQVLLAYVGGKFSTRSLRMGMLLGSSGCCQIRVVTVGIASSHALRLAQSRARNYFDFWKVSAKYQTLKGNTEEKILDVCVSENVDLLILGASETRDGKERQLPSISQALVERVNCPVMIVR